MKLERWNRTSGAETDQICVDFHARVNHLVIQSIENGIEQGPDEERGLLRNCGENQLVYENRHQRALCVMSVCNRLSLGTSEQ
jgi:hypothetical protein